MPPCIAIPTTGGTGAEATPWAVITRHEDGMKFWVGDEGTIPDVALVDPGLSVTLPSHLTAATGMDALSHLVEAYVSTRSNPLLDPLILHGIELIGRSLRTAVAQGRQHEARSDMMQASLIGGMAICSKLLGACHSLAHPLSGLAELHHGLACGIMLPHQMSYSLIGAMGRYGDIAVALDDVWLQEMSVRERAMGSVTAVAELMHDIGLPTRLSELGVNEELIPALAKAAYKDQNWRTNPREVSEEALADLYTAAL
jgi:alcohol dehydrogenase